jgi:hypothetical protein
MAHIYHYPFCPINTENKTCTAFKKPRYFTMNVIIYSLFKYAVLTDSEF